jgi:hypothetical protein
MKKNWLILFTEIISVYSEKCVKHINTLLEKVTPNLKALCNLRGSCMI